MSDPAPTISNETPISEPVRPQSTLSIVGELWTCSPAGEQIDNITRYVESCTVSYNFLNEIKGSMRAVLRRDAPTQAITDCLMPWVRLNWRTIDGAAHEVYEPLGVFYYLPPDETITETTIRRAVEGMDSLWRIGQLTSDSLQWFDTGKDYGEAAYQLLQGRSPVPLDLPKTASTIVTPKTVRPNDYLLKNANDLYMSGDYWDLSAGRYGTVSTSKRTVLGKSDPARILRSNDVVGTIQRSPDRQAFCNQVFLSSNNPEADLTLRDGYKVSFIDPASPFNIYRSPIISKAISDSRDESFDTMRNRAIGILEAAAGMQRRLSVPVWPDPRFNAREAWEVHITQNDGFAIADGVFRVEQIDFGLTSDSFAQLVTLSELVNVDHVVEGTVG
jgi:hypothetical protein